MLVIEFNQVNIISEIEFLKNIYIYSIHVARDFGKLAAIHFVFCSVFCCSKGINQAKSGALMCILLRI